MARQQQIALLVGLTRAGELEKAKWLAIEAVQRVVDNRRRAESARTIRERDMMRRIAEGEEDNAKRWLAKVKRLTTAKAFDRFELELLDIGAPPHLVKRAIKKQASAKKKRK